QFQARQSTKRELCEGQEANSLREQLDQCLRRLSDARTGAAERDRQAEEKYSVLQNALSGANSRLAKLNSLEADAASRAVEIQKLEGERHESNANLAKERSRIQHLVGAVRDMEDESAALSSREREAVSQAEALKQELKEQGSKVSELSLLCEELQRRIVRLQSGEEVQASRRQVAEALALAERQDELLGDASVRLDQLNAESRRLEEELARNRESVDVAKSILEPVFVEARSQLGLGPGGPRFRPPRTMAAARQSHVRQSGSRTQQDFEVVTGGAGLQSGESEEGDEEELVEAEDLAREAADIILHVLAGVGLGRAQDLVKAADKDSVHKGVRRSRQNAFHMRGQSQVPLLRRGSPHPSPHPVEPLHQSDVAVSPPRCVEQGEEEEDIFSRRYRRRPFNTDGEENQGDSRDAQTYLFCAPTPGTVKFDCSMNGDGARCERRENIRPGVLLMPDRDALRRMENIRRGEDRKGRVGLVDGVKAKRRGHLQGGKAGLPPTSIADSWMKASLGSIKSHAPGEKDGVITDDFVDFSRPRACITTGTRTDVSRHWRKPPLGSQSPSTRKIRQRINDAQATLRSLRSATT
ncbi:unnamed protein product, partial [Hapterophycus canaliculatus]